MQQVIAFVMQSLRSAPGAPFSAIIGQRSLYGNSAASSACASVPEGMLFAGPQTHTSERSIPNCRLLHHDTKASFALWLETEGRTLGRGDDE